MTDPAHIYHITGQPGDSAVTQGQQYTATSLRDEGFIHCSSLEQLPGVVSRYYAADEELRILVVDTAKLESRLKYENTTGGSELFPHVYGPIDLTAIVKVIDLDLGGLTHLQATGRFPVEDSGTPDLE